MAALGIYSSDQTEAALIRENQSACFRCEPKHADGGAQIGVPNNLTSTLMCAIALFTFCVEV